MANFGPFLLFDGNCAEAMEFYRSCFGGELLITRLGDTPMKAQFSPDQYDKVVNARLIGDPITITATDWLHPTRIYKQGNTVTMYISQAPYALLKEYFEKLSEGADPNYLDALTDMPFGTYGHLADKYGVHWTFQGEKQLV